METPNAPQLSDVPIDKSALIKAVTDMFGMFRAEWMNERIYELFAIPEYFPELVSSSRPCVLEGGRGTGKTTVLKGLSYEGQYALAERGLSHVLDTKMIGLYYRVEMSVARTFTVRYLPEEKWSKLFSHYINLLFCELIFDFLEWDERVRFTSVAIPATDCEIISQTLGFSSRNISIGQLRDGITLAKAEFEVYVNNIVDEKPPILSVLGVPFTRLIDLLTSTPTYAGKSFVFLIDEFEALEDYQQVLVNTMIKQSTSKCSYKIGVKELGWRQRSTLRSSEQLLHPADYAIINITERLDGEAFSNFAKDVCQERLTALQERFAFTAPPIETSFPGYSEDEEAIQLGIQLIANDIANGIRTEMPNVNQSKLDGMPCLQLYMLKFWADGHNQAIADVYTDYLNNTNMWNTRFGNYKHALLYTLRLGKRGIRKYYSGWSTLAQLSGNNIRFIAELYYNSLLDHLNSGSSLTEPVNQSLQTLAAQGVGQRYLSQLEGLADDGAKLKKLVLGLGRIFQIMAAHPQGHAPEVTQFYVTYPKRSTLADQQTDVTATDALLRSAVMHLALVRSPGNKLGAETGQTREDQYMLHPVFAAFFVCSYRKKRKMSLSLSDIMGLVNKPAKTIRAVLTKQKRFEDDQLPSQLLLWEDYFNDAS